MDHALAIKGLMVTNTNVIRMYESFITWRLVSLRINGYIKHDPPRAENHTMIPSPHFRNGIMGGYCTDQISQPNLEL